MPTALAQDVRLRAGLRPRLPTAFRAQPHVVSNGNRRHAVLEATFRRRDAVAPP
ncbi:hypothetical protein ACFL5O_02260 [Myxococcota bacterium]